MRLYKPKPGQPLWMSILPVDPSSLSFKELKNFKKFYALINMEDMKGAPQSICDFYRSFRFLYFFTSLLIFEKRFPALNKCWEDLRSRYSHMEIFDDGVFLESWIFFNFPIAENGKTVLDEFEGYLKNVNGLEEWLPFIQEIRNSRLGLYQEVLSTSKTTKFKELFTNRVVSTLRTVPAYNPNEIFLCRIVRSEEDHFIFGDPKCFPAHRREPLLNMVTDRIIDLGYVDPNFDSSIPIQELYERFMKVAGPYCMSIVCDDKNSEILQPNYWKKYHIC